MELTMTELVEHVTKIESGENGIHQYTEENISKRVE